MTVQRRCMKFSVYLIFMEHSNRGFIFPLVTHCIRDIQKKSFGFLRKHFFLFMAPRFLFLFMWPSFGSWMWNIRLIFLPRFSFCLAGGGNFWCEFKKFYCRGDFSCNVLGSRGATRGYVFIKICHPLVVAQGERMFTLNILSYLTVTTSIMCSRPVLCHDAFRLSVIFICCMFQGPYNSGTAEFWKEKKRLWVWHNTKCPC